MTVGIAGDADNPDTSLLENPGSDQRRAIAIGPVLSGCVSRHHEAMAHSSLDNAPDRKVSIALDEAIELYNQAEDVLLEDMPIIPMFFGLEQAVHSENVSGVFVDVFGQVDTSKVTVNS